jgi:hypothetical protein
MHPYFTQNLMAARVHDRHARATRVRLARQARLAIRRANRSRGTAAPLADAPVRPAEQPAGRARSASGEREPVGQRAA